MIVSIFCLVACGLFANIQQAQSDIESPRMEVKMYRGDNLRPLLPLVNEWIVSRYIEFPFLYVAQGEVPPTHVLADDPNGFVLFAEEQGKKVGLLMASPLDSSFLLDVKYSPLASLGEIEEKGYDPGKILYIHGFLVAPEKRNDFGLIQGLYKKAVALAQKMGKTQICYFTTIREEDHPLKPNSYVPLEPFNDVPTPFRDMGITFNLTWPTLQSDGSVKVSENLQALYVQDI